MLMACTSKHICSNENNGDDHFIFLKYTNKINLKEKEVILARDSIMAGSLRGSWFHGIHIQEQREMNTYAWLPFSFSFSLELQPTEWYHAL